MTRSMWTLAALAAGAAALLAVELGAGALSFGETRSENACTAEPSYSGGGLDGAVQRTVLSGLNGAACELRTTREELVLSFGGPSGASRPIHWDPETVERAVRAGLLRSIDDAEEQGSLPGFVASALRAIARRAPIAWLVDVAS